MNEEINNFNKSILIIIVAPIVILFGTGIINHFITSPIFWMILILFLISFVLTAITSKIYVTDLFIEKRDLFFSLRMEYKDIKSVRVATTYVEYSFVSYITLVGNDERKMTIQLAPLLSDKHAIATIFKGITLHVDSVRENESLLAIANGDVTKESLFRASFDERLTETVSWKNVFMLLFFILLGIFIFIFFSWYVIK